MPTASAGGYVAFLAATLSSIVESVGDYYAAARISGAPPPPPHAVNRGIAMEGLASIFSGLVGSGHGTTSYSGNIGAIGITKVHTIRCINPLYAPHQSVRPYVQPDILCSHLLLRLLVEFVHTRTQ